MSLSTHLDCNALTWVQEYWARKHWGLCQIYVNNICCSPLIYKSNHFVIENNQVGQAWFNLGKSMLTVLNHHLYTSPKDLLHDFVQWLKWSYSAWSSSICDHWLSLPLVVLLLIEHSKHKGLRNHVGEDWAKKALCTSAFSMSTDSKLCTHPTIGHNFLCSSFYY